MSVDIPAHIKAKRMASGAVTTQIEGVTYNIGKLLGDPTRPLQKSRKEIFDPKKGLTREVNNSAYGAGNYWDATAPVEVLMESDEYHSLDKQDLVKLLSLLLISIHNVPNSPDNAEIVNLHGQVLARICQGIKDEDIKKLVYMVLVGVFGGGHVRERLFDQFGNIKHPVVDSIWKMMHGNLEEMDQAWYESTGWRLSKEGRLGNSTQELWYKIKERTNE